MWISQRHSHKITFQAFGHEEIHRVRGPRLQWLATGLLKAKVKSLGQCPLSMLGRRARAWLHSKESLSIPAGVGVTAFYLVQLLCLTPEKHFKTKW